VPSHHIWHNEVGSPVTPYMPAKKLTKSILTNFKFIGIELTQVLNGWIWPTGTFLSINLITHHAVHLFNCEISHCNQLLTQSVTINPVYQTL
jgi:hypothetical protein